MKKNINLKSKKIIKKQKISPYTEFDKLCRKYPNHKFIGNTTFNFETLKKGMWIYHQSNPKKSLISPGDNHIIIRNRFKGKFDIKGKI